MRFELATAARIVFGPGTSREAAAAINGMGNRVLLVTGSSPSRHLPLAADLTGAGLAVTRFEVPEEPSVALVRRGTEVAVKEACDTVVALGGGSAIDAGKAVAALLTNGGDVAEYLEVIGPGLPIRNPPAPFVAIPSTAGTGSEVTRNAVLASPERRVKVSMRSPLMLPRLAIVDPELTYGMPPALTAGTGLDALTQLIEPYVSLRANPVTDACCLEGMRRVGRSLERACRDGGDASARTDMAFASLMGGFALANAGLGVVHGFAAPVGGMFPAPHGAVCAALLAPGIEANVRALRKRGAGGEFLARYGAIAAVLCGDPNAAPEESADFVRRLCARLSIPPLRAYGVAEGDIPELVARASASSSMKGNPVALTAHELEAVLRSAI